MSDLRCSVENCVYNEEKYCCKGDIMVGGKNAVRKDDTCCDSFRERKEEGSYTSAVLHPSQTISIDCEAEKCVYNNNYKCHAEHVDIKGCGACDCRETTCATFKEK